MKEAISTPASPAPIGPHSQGLRTETLAQTHQVLRNIRSILEAGGSSMNDVVKVTAHLADVADLGAFNRLYAEYRRPPYPVRTTVGSQLLGILVEVDVMAAGPAEWPASGAADGGPR